MQYESMYEMYVYTVRMIVFVYNYYSTYVCMYVCMCAYSK